MSAAPATTHEMIENLRRVVLDYAPGINTRRYRDDIECPDDLYIGLFGQTGCGKTSLINSLKYSVNEELRRSQWYQVADQEMTGGHTKHRYLAPIAEHIFVVDNRGGDLHTPEAIEEVKAQLEGRRGYSQRVEWDRGNSSDDGDLDQSKIDLKLGDPIGCVVFVFNARLYQQRTTDANDITHVIQLRDVIAFIHRNLGRYPGAVITHVDVAEEKAVNNLKAILCASGVTEIFEVANLNNDKIELEEQYQYILLTMLDRCMTDGDETLVFKHYRQKEEKRMEDIRKKMDEEIRKTEADRQKEINREAERRAHEEATRREEKAKESKCTII